MRGSNSVLEDICAEIGFTATTRLIALAGGGSLYVPTAAEAGHPMALAIGLSAWRRMVGLWPGETLDIPLNAEYHHATRLRAVAALIQSGMAVKDICGMIGLTERHVRRLRTEAEEIGLLPLVLRARGAKSSPEVCA